jgi:hypothetical protein
MRKLGIDWASYRSPAARLDDGDLRGPDDGV